MTPTAPTKPATLPAVAVARHVFGLAQNASYRAANRGQLADGLPVFRAGGHRWQVATAQVEQVIGRPLDESDLAAIERLEHEMADGRRERRTKP
jgi:hypothetical protein